MCVATNSYLPLSSGLKMFTVLLRILNELKINHDPVTDTLFHYVY